MRQKKNKKPLSVYLTELGEVCIRDGEGSDTSVQDARTLIARIEMVDELLEIADWLTERMDKQELMRMRIVELMGRMSGRCP